ncbi:MAG: hypothetical protein ACRD1T_18620 [Acidimicrobiia bacterium]
MIGLESHTQIAGSAAGGAVAGSVADPPGTVAGLIVGAVVGYAIDQWGDVVNGVTGQSESGREGRG